MSWRSEEETRRLNAELEERVRERTRALEEAHDEVAAERRMLRQLLGRLHEGVVAIDADLRVDFANAAARRFMLPAQIAEGEALPEPWPQFPLRDLAAALFMARADEIEGQVVLPGDRIFGIVGIPPRGRQGALIVITDVTERERRERAERDFVTNAAHELRTPLAAITSAVEVLQGGAKHDESAREMFLDHIQRETARLTRLTRSLLLLSRVQRRQETAAVEVVALAPLLAAVARDLSPAEGVTVHVQCAPELAALANRDLAEQALFNLAANAVRHTDAGAIVLAARRADARQVDIEVRDTGRGIEPDEQERVFDRFYSGSEGGFGLGLPIVREAVAALGGTVELQSVPGRGTTARVRLPAAELVQA